LVTTNTLLNTRPFVLQFADTVLVVYPIHFKYVQHAMHSSRLIAD